MYIYSGSVTRYKLIELINNKKLNQYGIEVGVQEGVFSKYILENWSGQKLYMVDAWRKLENYVDMANVADEVHALKMLTSLENTQTFKNKRCVICDLSLEAAKMFPDEYFDWIYLDAAHDKESVSNDLKAWLPKLKKGGIMCGDDYLEGLHFDTMFGVKSALAELEGAYTINEISARDEISQWWFEK